MRRGTALLVVALFVGSAPPAAGRTSTPTLSRPAFDALERAQALVARDRPDEAVAVLRGRLEGDRGSAYERAVLQQSLGVALLAQDRPIEALAAFEAALADDALPEHARRQTRLQVGQLQLLAGRIEAGIATLQAWVDDETRPPASALVLLGNAYAQGGRHAEATPWVERGIAAADEPVPMEWLRLAAQLHLVLGEPRAALPHLVRLTRTSERESDWEQLVAVQRALGREEEALASAQLSAALGHRETSAEQVELAGMLLAAGRPMEAAALLEHGLESGRVERSSANLGLLARSLRLGRERERALAAFERAARESGASGDWLELGQLQLEAERWEDAEAALRRALAGGDVRERAEAQLRLGVALLQQDRRDEAASAFAAASAHSATRRDARRWQAALQAR